MSQLFVLSVQSIGASTSASVLPMNNQDWFPLGWTDLISLQSKGLSRVFSNTRAQKHQFFSSQPCLWSSSHISLTQTIALTRWTFAGKIMSLHFNMLSRLVIAFLPRARVFYFHGCSHPSSVISEPMRIKPVTVCIVSPSLCHEVMCNCS